MTDRRRFLTQLAAGGLAASPGAPRAHAGEPMLLDPLRSAVARRSQLTADESFWKLVKDQFPLRDGLIMMNAANLAPSPLSVSLTVELYTRDVDADASFQNRAKFATLREHARGQLASYVGAQEDEIAITRNTSEGNNIVVNGVDLGPGDEVLLWDENHPTNNVAWEVRAARLGFTVRKVTTPEQPASADELVAVFANAVSPQTKVLAFSHISNVSGVMLPARQLCALARARGILTLVDGAQAFGAIQLDLHDLGCDCYTASAHKWFLGPKEAGILYVRRDRVGDLWASNVGVGWSRALEHGAQKFDNLGQRDDACVAAMGTAVELHQLIGPPRIEQRVRDLVEALTIGLTERLPGVHFSNPRSPAISAGVLVFIPPRGDAAAMYNTLYRDHRIAGAPRGPGIRLSPHIYNTMEDITRVVDAIGKLG